MRKLNFSFIIINIIIVLSIVFFVKNEYYISLGVYIIFNAINASCLNVLLGYAGVVSLGQAAFFGLGAYAVGILTVHFGVNPYMAVTIGIFFSGLVALIVGYPALKLHGHYLAMATLGFGMIIYIFFNEMDFFTGGPSGLTGIENLPFFGIDLGDEFNFFIFMAIIYLLFLFLMELFDKSFLSYKLKFIHESENASKSYGINVARTKLVTFIVVACITSLNGSLFAFYSNFISPVSFSFKYSVEILTMAVVGGLGSVTGGNIGAFVLTLLPEIFAEIEDYEMVIYGAFLGVTVLFFDGGIAKIFKRLVGRYASSE